MKKLILALSLFLITSCDFQTTFSKRIQSDGLDITIIQTQNKKTLPSKSYQKNGKQHIEFKNEDILIIYSESSLSINGEEQKLTDYPSQVTIQDGKVKSITYNKENNL